MLANNKMMIYIIYNIFPCGSQMLCIIWNIFFMQIQIQLQYTAMMDENEKVLLWYIDMIAKQGIDVDGVPYFDDLIIFVCLSDYHLSQQPLHI